MTDHTETKRLAQIDLACGMPFSSVDPEELLGLIAENERARDFMRQISLTSGDKGAVMAARELLKELGHE